MKPQSLTLLYLATLLPILSAIYLPLAPKRPRCMMVYTIGDIESVKIFLNLPEMPSQGREEHYLFTMRNTETEEIKSQEIQHGSFNREYELTPSKSVFIQMSSMKSACSSIRIDLLTTSSSTTKQRPSTTSTTLSWKSLRICSRRKISGARMRLPFASRVQSKNTKYCRKIGLAIRTRIFRISME